ncbi:DUF3939 domain-containing protein [Aquibacillus kalidii]|uniref:DUF3939 domain-containing protein n=1 Tax=Aquibacillus kalidii TaxID=2762597 RepID=UPI00164733CB|nr:DUF3939 domain-containing protein [Aquibacillus kalidii]
MWKKFNRKESQQAENQQQYPTKDISFDELKTAIQEYSSQLPREVPLSVLINDDLTIDYQLLAPILKGIPESIFYMSRETYDLFHEQDYALAIELDNVQKAVDDYIRQTNELPIINGDPYKKISFHKLSKLRLLASRPENEYYLTDQEDLVTTIKPK